MAEEKQIPPPDPGVLYREAVRAMDRGDYQTACPALEKLVGVVPEGLGAKFTLAECHEEAGRLASAYDLFLAVEKEAAERGQQERSTRATERAAALKPKLAQIAIMVPKLLVSGYGLEIKLDGAVLDASQWDAPRFVDAGEHLVVVEAKAGRHWEERIQIADGETIKKSIRDLMKFEAPGKSTTESAPSEVMSAGLDEQRPRVAATPSRPFPLWQVIMGGVGLAAIGGGVAFKLDSLAVEKRIVERCGADLVCPLGVGYDPAADNARKNIGFGLFAAMGGAGVLAIGAATFGVILERPGKRAERSSLALIPTVSSAFGGAVVSGSF